MLARVRLDRRTDIGARVRILGPIWIRGLGRIRIGDDAVLDASVAPIELHAIHLGSEIIVGAGVRIGSGTSIEAEDSIRIGDKSTLGRFCRLMDSHFHPTIGDRTKRPPPSPIVVAREVDLGDRSIVIAGGYLEDGVRVCPGTVVTRRVRAGSTIRGVPGQVVAADASTGGRA
jgi:acetyltransferase-like isoleucine patch superfamily enzyme